MPAESDFLEILATLVRHEVEFVVVGGIAAILQGSTVMTEDLDIVYSTEPGNIVATQEHRLADAQAAVAKGDGRGKKARSMFGIDTPSYVPRCEP